MSKDLLEQFRGAPAPSRATAAVPPPVAEPAPTPPARARNTGQVYQALRVAEGRQQRLKLRPRRRAWERINYGYLQRIVEDGRFGTQLGLVFSFAVIIIKGRNLQAVADAIDQERCESLTQFDPERWARLSDPAAPYIEGMEFHVQTRVEASDQLLADIEAEDKRRGA